MRVSMPDSTKITPDATPAIPPHLTMLDDIPTASSPTPLGRGYDATPGRPSAPHEGLCIQPPRRISMKMSSRRAALKRSSVTQHRPHDVDPPTRQSDESLSVSLALGSLAIVEGPGLRTTA